MLTGDEENEKSDQVAYHRNLLHHRYRATMKIHFREKYGRGEETLYVKPTGIFGGHFSRNFSLNEIFVLQIA